MSTDNPEVVDEGICLSPPTTHQECLECVPPKGREEASHILELIDELDHRKKEEIEALKHQHLEELRYMRYQCREEMEAAVNGISQHMLAEALALREKQIRQVYGQRLDAIAQSAEQRLQTISNIVKQHHENRVILLKEALHRMREISRNFDLNGEGGVLALRRRLDDSNNSLDILSESLQVSHALAAIRRSVNRGEPFTAHLPPLTSSASLQDSEHVRHLSEASHSGVASPAQLATHLFQRHSFDFLRSHFDGAIEPLNQGDVCSFYQHLKHSFVPTDPIPLHWIESAGQTCRVQQALDDLELALKVTPAAHRLCYDE